jgi:tetratricopeptide (TPR) repeat protein
MRFSRIVYPNYINYIKSKNAMKKIIALFLVIFYISVSNAQTTSDNTASEIKQMTDSLTTEQKALIFSITEQVMLNIVDSAMNEGMYMKALEFLDSIQVNWKKVTGTEPTYQMYLRKSNILMNLEEWQELVLTTEECLRIHKEVLPEKIAAFTYSMQGSAYRNLKNYKSAIRSYEYALSQYNRVGDFGSQGDMMCRMASCYDQIGKVSMASTLYEKGLAKFLEYFGTTRSSLLRGIFTVNDSYMKVVLGVFSTHLFEMAVHEQNNGDRIASKDYLKMSANCGNGQAKSEYKRIYGY